jgi:hypothetical protein
MGVTIHYRFARFSTPEHLLKKVEALAVKLGMKIEHRSWNHIVINPHENSEWINLHWQKVRTIRARDKEKYDYDSGALDDLGELDENMWFCSNFTKTHYAGVEAHIKVAELLRFIAAHSQKAEVSDEADYYETGMSKTTLDRLKAYWDDYNKSLGLLAAKLKETFGNESVLCGGDM